MKFGKLKDPGNLEMTLPPDDPATTLMLAKVKKKRPRPNSALSDAAYEPRIYVGCPIWQDDDMAAKLYPAGTPSNERLASYARQFNAIELNATRYGIKQVTVRSWASQVGPTFQFCPKAPDYITQAVSLEAVEDRFKNFSDAARLFGEHLGPTLLGFYESFSPVRLDDLDAFLEKAAMRIPLAVEVRNREWFRDESVSDALGNLLEKHGVTWVLTDTPGRRDVLHQRLTTDTAFIRYNGQELGPFDYHRLDQWAERVGTWIQQGLRRLYFFTHYDPKHYSVELAAYFLHKLHLTLGLELREPHLLIPNPWEAAEHPAHA